MLTTVSFLSFRKLSKERFTAVCLMLGGSIVGLFLLLGIMEIPISIDMFFWKIIGWAIVITGSITSLFLKNVSQLLKIMNGVVILGLIAFMALDVFILTSFLNFLQNYR